MPPDAKRRTERLDGPAEGAAPEPVGGPLTSGTILAGRYVIRSLAGEGGGGAVFQAEDLALHETIALKVLSPPLTPEAIDRFRREVRLTRRIAHPNVVRVHDLVTLPGSDTHLLTMQWIDGDTLSERVGRHGALSPRAALRVFRGLAAALAASHRLSIVHRDVKPSNVMLDRDGTPLLLDFGIASEPDAITSSGARLGTPGFMAPEQERGEAVGPSADIYSVGLTVLFALGLAPAEVHRAPRPIRRILSRCLAARPADRYRDGGELARGLARTKGPVLPAVGVAALVIAAAGASVSMKLHSHRGLGLSAFSSKATREDSGWLSVGAPELLSAALSDPGDLQVDWPASAPRADEPWVRGEIVGDPPSLRVELVRPDGTVEQQLKTDPSMDLYGQADVIAREIRRAVGLAAVDGPGAARLTTANADAFREFSLALWRLQERRGADALEAVRRAVSIDPGFARAQVLLVMLAGADGYGSRAEARAALTAAVSAEGHLSRRDRQLVDAVAAMDRPETTTAEPFLRYFARYPGDRFAWRVAARVAPPALREDLLRRWIEVHPRDPEPHNLLGYHLLSRTGDLPRAEAELRQAIALAPGDANYFDSLADLLTREGRTREALAEEAKATALAPRFAAAAVKAAELALADDDLSEASRRLESAREVIGPESGSFDRWVAVRAALWMTRRDPKAAQADLDQLANTPGLGARAFAVREEEALVRAATRDAAGAERALAAAERLAEDYHAERVPLPGAYVAALAAFDDGARLAAARASRGASAAAPSALALIDARVLQLRGDVSGAIERLKREPAPSPGVSGLGAPFLESLLLARLLAASGRTGEARIAYAEAIRRHRVYPQSPDAAYEWQPCLAEAAAADRAAGDEAGARELEALMSRVKAQ